MKYRIKIITYKNGRKDYIPQKKAFFVWLGLDYDGETEFYNYLYATRKVALEKIDKNVEGNNDKQTIEFEYINK